MRPVFIYALCEPGTRTVRYIGKTERLKKRYREHLSQSVKSKARIGEWIRGLSAPPVLVVLCETSKAFWQDDEQVYIRSARALGMDLVNATDGGDGPTNPTEESRHRMSAASKAVHNTPEMREKMSVIARKAWADPNFFHNTPEGRAQIGALTKAAWETPGHREKQSASRKAAWDRPGERERRGKAQGDAARTPERRLAQRESSKKMWEDPTYRAAHAAGMAENRDKFVKAASARVRLGVKRPWASSKFYGVSFSTYHNKWGASVVVSGKLKNLGYFSSEEDAALRVDLAVLTLSLPNPLNFPNL